MVNLSAGICSSSTCFEKVQITISSLEINQCQLLLLR